MGKVVGRFIFLLGLAAYPLAIPAGPSDPLPAAPDYKTHFRMPEYRSRKQWDEHRNKLRQQILFAAGLLPMPVKSALHPKIVRRFDYSDYSIEVVLLETLPGYYLGGNLYRPAGKVVNAPAILIPHGHWKKGRLEDLPSYSVPALGINLARQGYVVFAYDMVGFNDTQQTPHSFGGWTEDLWSFHPMGLQLWNSIRALDYLQTLSDVDARRIGVTGASGGGSQTFLLGAVDDRVKAVAPVNMVSAYMQGGDPCEEAPGLRLNTFNVEIAAAIAPRPMLLVSSTHDWTRHTPDEEFPAIRHIYDLYGAANHVGNAHIDAEHNYNRRSREAVYAFLAEKLQPGNPPPDLTDRDFVLPDAQDLLAFPKGAREIGGYSDVFQMWKIAAMLRSQSTLDEAVQRQALRYALGVEWPTRTEFEVTGSRLILHRTGKSDRVTGYWRPGKGVPVLVVHPEGVRAALRTPAVEEMLRTGRPVLALDPFVGGTQRQQKQQFDDYFLSYNRSDAAEQVADLLTGLDFLRGQSRATPELIGLADAGIWCVFAAAVAPMQLDVIADLNGFGGSDQDFRDRFFVPGIQHAGGLGAALKLVNRARGLLPAQLSGSTAIPTDNQ